MEPERHLVIFGNGYTLFDERKEVDNENQAPPGDEAHLAHFLIANCAAKRPNTDIQSRTDRHVVDASREQWRSVTDRKCSTWMPKTANPGRQRTRERPLGPRITNPAGPRCMTDRRIERNATRMRWLAKTIRMLVRFMGFMQWRSGDRWGLAGNGVSLVTRRRGESPKPARHRTVYGVAPVLPNPVLASAEPRCE